MILSGVKLNNFRNHAATEIGFGPGINALLGENGQGKTNVLEAVSYLSLTKSFYAAGDADALQIGKDAFAVEGGLIGGGGEVAHTVHVSYTRDPPAKSFLIDGTAPDRLSSVIGRFPLVILSPENNAITFGGPAERRKFMDLTLSQVSRVYLDDLLEYRRVLRQRNRILTDARLRGAPVAGILEPWTENLARYGGRIAYRRRLFVEEFRSFIRSAYRDLVPATEEPEMQYRCGFNPGGAADPDGLTSALRSAMDEKRGEELRRGVSLAGPHRDELALTINGIGVQQFASQGQHKTLLVALKVAEFFYVRERREEIPLFLLDDVFSELDAGRAARILSLAAGIGQTMITTTSDAVFGSSIVWGDHHRRFIVERGTCRPAA
jgi:DNA replication and repair protein RecF